MSAGQPAAARPLAVPVLAVGAGGGPFTVQTLAQVTVGEVTSVQLEGVGHYALEAPQALLAAILDFADGIDAISESGF